MQAIISLGHLPWDNTYHIEGRMSISPNIPSAQESYGYETPGTPRWISVLFGLLIAGLAVVVYFGYTTEAHLTDDLGARRKTWKRPRPTWRPPKGSWIAAWAT